MPARYTFYIFLGILLIVSSLYGGVKKNSVQAKSNGSTITIWWETDNVSGIQSFKVLRSVSPLSGYEIVGTVYPKDGTSLYSFEDEQPFMKTTTLYYYRIATIVDSGSESYEPSLDASGVVVDHTTSGVRRTWGSIKAMFR